MRVGIVGAGYIAAAHASAYAHTDGVDVVAVADHVPEKAERLARRVGATPAADLNDVLRAGPDLVSICTPTPSHHDLVLHALDAGVHVLCEKPVARTLAEGEAIVAAAEAATGTVMVGHVSRFEPDHRRAQQLVARGRIGPLRMMSQSITCTMPDWSEGGWLADPAQSGGPILDLAVHSLDFLAWVNQSQPVRVRAVARDTDRGPATYALITLRYDNGALGLVETSWAHPEAHGFQLSTELVGADGRIAWGYDGLVGGVLHAADGTTTRWDPLGDRGFRSEVAAMVGAVRTGGPAPVSAAEGLAALRTALAAIESVRTGRTIDLAPWTAQAGS